MNIILLIILTVIFLLLTISGIFLMRIGFGSIPMISIFLFFTGVVGLFYLGSTLISDDFYIKETVCSYTVGKDDQVCIQNYEINTHYLFPTISDKIGLIYFITDIILVIILLREFILMMIHSGDCIKPEY